MKRIVFFTASAMLATHGMAQSSVTLFGVVDTGIGYYKNSGSGHVTGLFSGGHSTPRIGFRGVEDLGAGFSAGFWLEGSVNPDTGGGAVGATGLTFTRRSTVSLSGPFGEVRLGRDFVASYPLTFSFDVAEQRGLSQVEILGMSTAGVTGVNAFRTSNGISYFLPNTLGGLYGQAQYAFGEQVSTVSPIADTNGLSPSPSNAATDKTGNYAGARIGYASGPVNVAVSHGQYIDATRVVGSSSYASNFKVSNLGASYDFGVLKLMGFIQQDEIDGRANIADFKFKTYAIGTTIPVGASLIRVQASRYKQENSANGANKLSLGYVYNLSKRTALYADLARLDNGNISSYTVDGVSGLSISPPVPGGKSTALGFGAKHSF